jgi:hypothetical protein
MSLKEFKDAIDDIVRQAVASGLDWEDLVSHFDLVCAKLEDDVELEP